MSDKTLFPISEWNERTATRGRGSGNLIKERYVIGADNRGFFVGIDNGKVLISEKYSSKIEHLIPTAVSLTGCDPRDCFIKLCDALVGMGHTKYEYDEGKTLTENLKLADRHVNPWGIFPGKEYVGG